VSTEDESVPGAVRSREHETAAPPPPDAPVSSRRVWPWWVASLAFLGAAAALFAAFTVEIGHFEFRPGSARPTAHLVNVGADVPTHPPASDIAFTTVSLRQSTLASYVWAWFDDDVQVVADELILGNRSPQENRQFNLQLMDTSKQDAIRVALLELGYRVPVTIDGVVVEGVQEDSAATGLLERGDAVVGIDGETLDDIDDVTRIMAEKRPGDTVTLSVEPLQTEDVEDVDVVLGAAPDDPERGLIGISLQPRNPAYAFPIDVDIDSGNVGGPSAGLAFTLAVLDVLTPGELTGGLDVAVTGTIDGAGNVGDVGGVRQKTAAAIDEGYDVFLVPSREFDEAVERAGDDLEVIAVDTLRDALDALASLGGSGLGNAADEG
jgi:PDZ domain-containing protein